MKQITVLLILVLMTINTYGLSATHVQESFELSENYGKHYGVGSSYGVRIDNTASTGDILLVDLYAIAENGGK